MSKMRELTPAEVMYICEGVRLRGRSVQGAAGQFGSARLGKQIDSAQNDMLGVLLTIGTRIVGADGAGYNGATGYDALAVAFQSGADFFRNIDHMYRPEHEARGLNLPPHLRGVGDGGGRMTRAQHLCELADPVAKLLAQNISLYSKMRALESKAEDELQP